MSPKTDHEQHEHDARELRKAAGAVHKASDSDLPAALAEFGYRRTEWANSIPRDSHFRPVKA